MTDRRVRRRQHLTAWLVAALLGAGGALTIVTPAHAATTCTLTFDYRQWPASDGRRWEVDAKLTNTATVQSTNWLAFILFPDGAAVPQYWNIARAGWSADTWLAASWRRTLAPGEEATFGFEVDMPDWSGSPLPTSSRCNIAY